MIRDPSDGINKETLRDDIELLRDLADSKKIVADEVVKWALHVLTKRRHRRRNSLDKPK